MFHEEHSPAMDDEALVREWFMAKDSNALRLKIIRDAQAYCDSIEVEALLDSMNVKWVDG